MPTTDNTNGLTGSPIPPSTTVSGTGGLGSAQTQYMPFYQQVANHPFTYPPPPPKPREYQTQAIQRISIPAHTSTGIGSLEMTAGQQGDYVDFTFIPLGRQAIHFKAHRKDLDAFVNELTLAKLAK